MAVFLHPLYYLLKIFTCTINNLILFFRRKSKPKEQPPPTAPTKLRWQCMIQRLNVDTTAAGDDAAASNKDQANANGKGQIMMNVFYRLSQKKVALRIYRKGWVIFPRLFLNKKRQPFLGHPEYLDSDLVWLI